MEKYYDLVAHTIIAMIVLVVFAFLIVSAVRRRKNRSEAQRKTDAEARELWRQQIHEKLAGINYIVILRTRDRRRTDLETHLISAMCGFGAIVCNLTPLECKQLLDSGEVPGRLAHAKPMVVLGTHHEEQPPGCPWEKNLLDLRVVTHEGEIVGARPIRTFENGLNNLISEALVTIASANRPAKQNPSQATPAIA